MKELQQCPYSKATKCLMEEPCEGCEDYKADEREYSYLGDRLTDPNLKGQPCTAVRRNGKCIRSRIATMLVEFEGKRCVVLARRLRKIN